MCHPANRRRRGDGSSLSRVLWLGRTLYELSTYITPGGAVIAGAYGTGGALCGPQVLDSFTIDQSGAALLDLDRVVTGLSDDGRTLLFSPANTATLQLLLRRTGPSGHAPSAGSIRAPAQRQLVRTAAR
jgi:hypothetical protein